MAEEVSNFNDIERCILSKLEKCTDDFRRANLMRLDVLASYTAHSETKINGASILEEHLENYIPLVCNTSKINNYADLLKTKLKNSSHTNKKRLTKWEITKIDDISDILTEMNVNNSKYEDDDKSKNISNDQFYKLQLLHHQFVDNIETNKSTKHHEDLTLSSTPKNLQNIRQNLLTNDDKNDQPQTSSEFFRNASASMEHHYPFNNFNNTKNIDQNSTTGRQEIPHRNQVQVDKSNEFFQAASASMEHHYSFNNFNNTKNRDQNSTIGRQEIPHRNQVQVDKSNEFFQATSATMEHHHHHPPPPPLNDFHNTKNRFGNFTTERQEISQKNEVQTDKINEFFRTASMEYHIQNIKKNLGNSMQRSQQQHDQGPSSSSFEYGISKRSLGLGGRRNVRSKFVPPVKRTLEEMEESSGQFSSRDRDRDGGDSSEEIDSRLKNIDPKLIEMIKNEIMRTVTQTTWDDIAGLEYTKSVIQEAIVWPLLRPDIFTGLRRPPRGVLLFGPPGTGKTMIGKCIASQSKSTFFSISASSLTSKWVGEGEKMVRALFAVASVHQPSVVFIDEIDSLLCQRSENEHESSRRIKTEFLVQLDGAATSDDEKILIVGATNRPQELDEAARRRLVRRLYVPLPEYEARCKMLKNLLSSIKHELTDTDIKRISELTDGYSGADIKTLCTEASLEPIRSIPANLIPVFDKDNVRPVIFTDFEMALTRVRSSVSQDDLKQYIEWNKIYGSGNASK